MLTRQLGQTLAALLISAPLWAPPAAHAVEPISSVDNDCANTGGRDTPCAVDDDCAQNQYATVCVAVGATSSCQAPCNADAEAEAAIRALSSERCTGDVCQDASQCAVGETCVAGVRSNITTPTTFYCKAERFRVDLNLLDMCVKHYLDRTAPVLGGTECSLERNLNQLLDQDGNRQFDIFDLDLCVLAFLEQQGCAADSLTGNLRAIDPGATCCREDDDCGFGLYCAADTRSCQRDCGLIASREESITSLDRECTRALTVCDRERGRCEDVPDISNSTCMVDRDCLPGAYCLLGRCAKECYRSVDCPDGGWYCAKNNKCRAVPPPTADDGFVFDPQGYVTRFVRDQLKLDAIGNFDSSELAIMDLVTKRQVVGNASIAFGFRMEISYGLKEDAACFKTFVNCSDGTKRPPDETEAECTARQDDCLIDPSEEWIRPVSPFGTINAGGRPELRIELEDAVADTLSPGVYPATVTLIFDNGDSDSVPVTFTKASPSGEYRGSLTVYMDVVENALNGNRPLGFGMRIKVYPDQQRQWNTLMAAHQLDTDDEGFVDTTTGQLVHASLHGETALAFSRGVLDEDDKAPDEVQFVGIFVPDTGQMRLVGNIDISKNMQINAVGSECDADVEGLCVRNLFGRDIRRRIQFFGVFEEAIGRFHGLYRETLFGLIPNEDVTLEGGFILDQSVADDTPLPVDAPLGSPDIVEFPTKVGADIALPAGCEALATQCFDSTGAAVSCFADEATFDAYMAQAVRGNAATSGSGRTTILPDLVDFEDTIETALTALGEAADDAGGDVAVERAHLNIYEYLSDWITLCDDSDASPPPGCVTESELRCGLALHQRAILDDWIDMSAVEAPDGRPGVTPDVFCLDTLLTAGCPDEACASGSDCNTTTGHDYRALFAMQEHNRFWLNLVQAQKFTGDRARSDAFLTLFRNEVDPFAQGSALSFKSDQLRIALKHYDAAIEQIVGTDMANILFQWPARAFKQIGNDWLGIMQTVASDRLDAVAELVDLERRVFATTGEEDYRYAHQLMQQEYLNQVYLMVLQARWQEELFAYRGEAGPILEQGQVVLSKLNPVKNELGITANQVFFENSNPDLLNWERYREVLVGDDGAGGLVGDVQGQIAEAVEEMQAALADRDALETSLFETRGDLRGTLRGYCGEDFDLDATTDRCEKIYNDWTSCKWEQQSGNKDARCSESFTLEDGERSAKFCIPWVGFVNFFVVPTPTTNNPTGLIGTCNGVVDVFNEGVNGYDPKDDCYLDNTAVDLMVHGKPRRCAAGEMGQLLQEKALIDLQRDHVAGSVDDIIRQMEGAIELHNVGEGLELGKLLASHIKDIIIFALGRSEEVLENVVEIGSLGGKTVKCSIVAGLAFGTDCPQSAGAFAIESTVRVGGGLSKTFIEIASFVIEQVEQAVQEALDATGRSVSFGGELRQLALGVTENLLPQYQQLTLQSFNATNQIQDLQYQAQKAVDGYESKITFLAQHLVGRESGNLLKGEGLARSASVAFEDLLNFTYRMTMAYLHNYNVPAGDATNLVAQALALVTVDDVASFVGMLDSRVQDYCGLEGIDCDVSNNVETLRYSIRDQVFPQLRDVVDARTGKVLTAGQQFHNTITSPPHLKRRFRGSQTVDQIELLMPIPMTLKENAKGGPRWLIDPLSCNHLLDARKPNDTSGIDLGTHAVNVVGKNLDDASQAVRYELIRGSTDYLRSCTAESVQEEVGTLPVIDYPIRRWTVGYAPQNLNAQENNPPSYVTRSAPFTACTNFDEVGGELEAGPCWRYFARDRALASLDWKMVIPLQVGDGATANDWITGEGLREDQRPIIEDIVVYFRYRTRPINEF